MTKRTLVFLCLIFVFLIVGCSKAPTDANIKEAIESSGLSVIPGKWIDKAVSVEQMTGDKKTETLVPLDKSEKSVLNIYKNIKNRKVKTELIDIQKKGEFHSKEKYLLVTAKVKGTSEIDPFGMNIWNPIHFDGVGEYKVFLHNYGKWQAQYR
jgi:hypothetical protein